MQKVTREISNFQLNVNEKRVYKNSGDMADSCLKKLF